MKTLSLVAKPHVMSTEVQVVRSTAETQRRHLASAVAPPTSAKRPTRPRRPNVMQSEAKHLASSGYCPYPAKRPSRLRRPNVINSVSDASKHTLPAATLLETLVSFALVSIIFVIGAIIWLQLAGPAAPYRQTDQRLDCRDILRETEEKADLTDQVFTLHNTQYHRKIIPINPDRGLFEVSIAAYTPEGNLLMRRHKILHIHAQ